MQIELGTSQDFIRQIPGTKDLLTAEEMCNVTAVQFAISLDDTYLDIQTHSTDTGFKLKRFKLVNWKWEKIG